MSKTESEILGLIAFSVAGAALIMVPIHLWENNGTGAINMTFMAIFGVWVLRLVRAFGAAQPDQEQK